jgi:hypothetical protein
MLARHHTPILLLVGWTTFLMVYGMYVLWFEHFLCWYSIGSSTHIAKFAALNIYGLFWFVFNRSVDLFLVLGLYLSWFFERCVYFRVLIAIFLMQIAVNLWRMLNGFSFYATLRISAFIIVVVVRLIWLCFIFHFLFMLIWGFLFKGLLSDWSCSWLLFNITTVLFFNLYLIIATLLLKTLLSVLVKALSKFFPGSSRSKLLLFSVMIPRRRRVNLWRLTTFVIGAAVIGIEIIFGFACDMMRDYWIIGQLEITIQSQFLRLLLDIIGVFLSLANIESQVQVASRTVRHRNPISKLQTRISDLLLDPGQSLPHAMHLRFEPAHAILSIKIYWNATL